MLTLLRIFLEDVFVCSNQKKKKKKASGKASNSAEVLVKDL